jgi:hypothetical protein
MELQAACIASMTRSSYLAAAVRSALQDWLSPELLLADVCLRGTNRRCDGTAGMAPGRLSAPLRPGVEETQKARLFIWMGKCIGLLSMTPCQSSGTSASNQCPDAGERVTGAAQPVTDTKPAEE